jgi:hypothetical protein
VQGSVVSYRIQSERGIVMESYGNVEGFALGSVVEVFACFACPKIDLQEVDSLNSFRFESFSSRK